MEQGNPRRERTGRCLNIEHMSVSPLKPTKIEATTVDHRTTILCRRQTEREREILLDSACFAASCLLLRGLLFSRVSVVRLLVPASPSFSFYISIPVPSSGEGLQENVKRPLSLSIFRDKWIEICKGYISLF